MVQWPVLNPLNDGKSLTEINERQEKKMQVQRKGGRSGRYDGVHVIARHAGAMLPTEGTNQGGAALTTPHYVNSLKSTSPGNKVLNQPSPKQEFHPG
jgi:hypothetical protein